MAYNNELYHHGIPDQKWGVRRFQYSDGSLTPEGRIRYGYKSASDYKKRLNSLDKELAYTVGDSMNLQRKATALSKKAERYYSRKTGGRNMLKDGPKRAYRNLDEKGKQKFKKISDKINNEYMPGIDKANKRKEEIQNEIADIMTDAIAKDYKVIMKPTYRHTMRTGKRIAREFATTSMAVAMAYLSPVGIGVGYGGREQLIRGTKYKVTNPSKR